MKTTTDPETGETGEKVQIDVKEVPYHCLRGAANLDIPYPVDSSYYFASVKWVISFDNADV